MRTEHYLPHICPWYIIRPYGQARVHHRLLVATRPIHAGSAEMIGDMIRDIGDFIFVQDRVEHADAIMVVGGSYPELGERARKLWRQQYAPIILISGGVGVTAGKFPGPKSKEELYNKEYETEYDFLTDVLLENGVPRSAFYGENRSSYTKENALFTREVAEQHKLDIVKAILVCKPFHARRSLMFYQMAFPDTAFLCRRHPAPT
jgi:uncharacterized SAM-binding protein YcdF (DUF218 family)